MIVNSFKVNPYGNNKQVKPHFGMNPGKLLKSTDEPHWTKGNIGPIGTLKEIKDAIRDAKIKEAGFDPKAVERAIESSKKYEKYNK